ncbi:MAG: T9SS type A sorting domain-containing protein [Bacteroidota bacterium]|nr:T9SS type A sorting domain-containing protein [Bacteroidota bacterium]
MKKFTLSFTLFLFTSLIGSAQSLNWSAPLTVASGSSNIYPRITLMQGGKPLVIWMNSTTDKVYSAVLNGASFTTPLAVNPAGLVPFIANWAGAEVASSGDTAFIVFSSEPVMTGNIYAVRSIDGGMTFGDTVRVDQIGNDIPNFPTVAVGPGGNPIIQFMKQDSSTMANPEYVVNRSIDGGITYLPTVFPAAGLPGEACDCCPGSLVTSGNRVAMLYRNNISNIREMWASISLDAGATFPAGAEVDESNWMIMSCPSSGPSGIMIGDTLITTWMSEGTSGDPRIYVGTSNVLDQQIGFTKQMYPVGTTTQNFPVIAGSGDTIGVAWLGYNAGMQDVLFSYSLTGASGLGMQVDTITKGGSGQQSRPDLSFSNGKFHLVYSDSYGTDMEYRTAMIGDFLGVDEKAEPNFVASTRYQNGRIILTINSGVDVLGKCKIYNALGQSESEKQLTIRKGENIFQVEADLEIGMYYLNIHTGKNSITTKCQVIK